MVLYSEIIPIIRLNYTSRQNIFTQNKLRKNILTI